MTTKMRWDCQKQDCFNIKCRPKIQIFNDCFPGRIGFGDIDGWVDYQGKSICLLEWKGDGGELELAQVIGYTNFTKMVPLGAVFVAYGNAETMEVKSFTCFWNGKRLPNTEGGLESLKGRISAWCMWVDNMWLDKKKAS